LKQRHTNGASTQAEDFWSALMAWKPLILCVDDTPSLLEGQKMLLEENGYRILTATNGSDAVQVFVSHSVDLVILDYHMAGMNGALAAARMKNSKTGVPVMLVSGDDDVPPSDLEAVDCFLSKSGSISSFLEKVDYLLSLRFLFRPFEILETESARNPKIRPGL
jgi:CheY-like chemotaxis protein